MGVPAPRSGYARVSVNGQDYGLYLLLETIDGGFLDRWYGNHDGSLYEGAYGVDLYSYYVDSFEYDQGPDSTDRSDLEAVVAILDDGASEDNLEALEELFDMDEFLRNMAVEALALHWDGYTTANNYRLYHDPATDHLRIIPWGADQTFLNYYYYPWSARGRVFQWCLAIDSCADRYDELLTEASYTMEGLEIADGMEELANWLRDDIDSDPRREFSMSTHDYYLDQTQSVANSWPQSVRDQLAAR